MQIATATSNINQKLQQKTRSTSISMQELTSVILKKAKISTLASLTTTAL
jgi:hypothetical protein